MVAARTIHLPRTGINETFNPNAIGVGANGDPAFTISPERSGSIPLNSGRAEPRLAAIELLRVLSAYGIIWFHCQAPGATVGLAGLPALIGLSVGLAIAPRQSAPLLPKVRKRARRILLPWVFWCCVYAAWKMIGAFYRAEPMTAPWAWWMLLTGPAIHLWYLPFAFVVTCLAAALSLDRPSPGLVTPMISLLGVATVLAFCSWWLSCGPRAYPFAQWVFGAPAVCVGLVLPHATNARSNFIGAISLTATVTLASVGTYLCGNQALSVPYIVGTALLTGAWIVRVRPHPLISFLSSLSFGIYLTHPLVDSVMRHSLNLPEGGVEALIVITATTGLVAILRCCPIRAVL